MAPAAMLQRHAGRIGEHHQQFPFLVIIGSRLLFAEGLDVRGDAAVHAFETADRHLQTQQFVQAVGRFGERILNDHPLHNRGFK
ncbi:hypothetical protein GC176_26275 [bacterium]|nr:hypothetical protein [bacterium]